MAGNAMQSVGDLALLNTAHEDALSEVTLKVFTAVDRQLPRND